MEVTTFRLVGKQAHFRKFYGTNTAMSYYLPPRTTLMGVLAARIGLAKESYHELLHSDRIRLGVASTGALRKSFHRVNNLKVKSVGDFRGREGHQQTPLELVTAPDIRHGEVSYRVYVAAADPTDAATYERVKAALTEAPPGAFACCLGAAFCTGSIRDVCSGPATPIEAGTPLALRSAVKVDDVAGFDDFESRRVEAQGLYLEEEIFPLDYAADSRRTSAVARVIYPTGPTALRVRLTVPAYRLNEGDGTAFTFIEP